MKPGLYPEITHDAYLADPCDSPSLSSSCAHAIVSQSPLHAWHGHPKLGNGERGESTSEMDFGTLMHALVLGGGGPNIVSVEADDWRTKAAKEARDAARAAGKLPVLARKLEPALKLADTLRGRLAAKGIKFEGQSEVTAVWRKDGVLCRARFDHMLTVRPVIYDLKFLNCADPVAFGATAARSGYDIQRAAYVEAYETLLPAAAGRVEFIFIVVESSPPWPFSLIQADGSMRELGERRWKRGREVWARCLESGTWPSYSNDVVSVGVPEWALSQDMAAQMQGLSGGSAGVTF